MSIKDEQYLNLLGMSVPQKPTDVHNLLRELEKRKMDLFQDLLGFLPCAHCHKRALISFFPDKYFSEEESEDNETTSRPPERLFRLPFEFDDNDKLGPWDILLSEDTIRDMRHLESPLVIKAIMKKLGQISSGKWYELQRKVETHNIPVFEVELPDKSGLKILWQVDYGFSVRSYSLMQLVKVWAVTTDQEQINKTLENLSIVHQVYTSKHSRLCTVEKVGKDDVILPMSLDSEEIKSSEDNLHSSQIDDEKLLDVHKMLVTNKFVPLSTNLYKSLVLGGFDFTFQVSKKEYEIINNPSSAIIIGRSGTGKTTCIVFRQIASFLNSQLYKTPSSLDNNGDFYKRQIFITVSHNLCRRVKEYFNRLQESAELAGKKMSTEQFHEYIRKKEEEGGDVELTNHIMLEEGDEEQEFKGIPDSFRDLKDHHFPLFITYDKFSKMLQKTYDIDVRKLTKQQKPDYAGSNEDIDEELYRTSFVDTTESSWAHFVNYDLFHKKYWPRFNDYSRKLDCELVYAEFSIIKGSNPEMDCLSREDYREISTKKYPAFCQNRDQIYDLFQQYEKMKARNGDYDSMDRTLAILRCAKKKGLGGPHIHEVYIDECQDNQIVDFALILKVFENVDAVFLAGDIAQCIARGSSFRFQDLRALMYQWELSRIPSNQNRRNIAKPKQFELNVNYRSHNGILQLASSVIDLIWRFFPKSIDRLSRERGEIGGPRPIVFDGFQKEHFKVFSAGERKANYIEFGAEQVIIVRDDEAKLQLKDLIGKAGLVMTVFEAKGMEFSDVLLYNFFTDSPARLKWRVILSDLIDKSEGVQTFSHEKHYILSSELKHLYVAVTRARQHIWICDENAEYSMPIRMYWNHHGLIRVTKSVDEINTFSTLAKKSTSHEWDQQGKNFFAQRQYEQAMFCFEKSENEESYKLANAYYLQQIARDSVNNSDDSAIKKNFISAAQAFEKCSRPTQAASCYKEISMYKEAGKVYAEWNMYEPAALCYNKAKMFREAGEYYEKAKKYTDAVVAYKSGSRYEEVIDLMQRHRKEIDEKIFHRVTRLVNIYYRRENNKVMSEKALSIIPTQEERFELLKDHAPEEFLEACEKNGQFRHAAEDLHSRGKFKEAADMFIRSGFKDEDVIEAFQCLLHLCRVNVLKSSMTNTMSPSNAELRDIICTISETLNKLESQLSKALKKSERWKILMEEFRLYDAYLGEDLSRVHKCIQFFRKREEFVAEFRAINIWLKIPQQSDIQFEYWHERLQCLQRLCADLAFPYIDTRRNVNNLIARKEFEEIFVVSEVKDREQKRKCSSDNPLVHLIDEDTAENIDYWHVYDVEVMHHAISQLLVSYIYELLWNVNQRGREIPFIGNYICYKYESCQKSDCRKHHVVPSPTMLYKRLTLAWLQYTVLRQWDLLYHLRLLKDEQSKVVRPAERWWTEQLVNYHIRYQSPQTSCPEVTNMVLANYTWYELINTADKIWLGELSNEPNNFAVMLKCMLVFQQFRNKWSIDKFNWEMSKTIELLYPNELPVGYDYYGYGYAVAIPVGKRLSLFYIWLYSKNEYCVINAIMHINIFIQYAINNAESVYIDTPDAFSDLATLMEFKVSLVFAVAPGYCNFCLPRSYLVNYFDACKTEPLIPDRRRSYDRENYNAAVKDSLEQVQQLLEYLIYDDRFYQYQSIILRLIRLLVLIGRNEPTFATKVFNLFKYLSKDASSINIKIKKYMDESQMGRLVNILKDDLKETGCDSLVIVQYQWGGLSRFAELEKSGGVMVLKYKSNEEFRESLMRIKSRVVIEESTETGVPAYKSVPQRTEQNIAFVEDEDDDRLSISRDASEPTTDTQAWFRQIQDSPRAQEEAKKIQDWFRRAIEKRQKSREHVHDQALEKIYNDVRDFCQAVTYWECAVTQKGEKAVRSYHMLLRGLAVDVIVELTKLRDIMDKIKNKLKKKINDPTDGEKLEIYLEFEDDLKEIHNDVKLRLNSISTTEGEHEEADIEWLKYELQQARNTINQVKEWIDNYKAAI